MPCLKCDQSIPNGTARRLCNGLMCPTCLSDTDVEVITNHLHSRLSAWAYYKTIPDHSSGDGYIIVDKVSNELIDFDWKNYIYVLEQSDFNAIDYLNYFDYIIVPPDSIIRNTTLNNAVIIPRGDLSVVDSEFNHIYFPKLSENPTAILCSSSHIESMRSLNSSSLVELQLSCSNSPIPIMHYIRLRTCRIRDYVGPLTVPRMSENAPFIIDHCSITTLMAHLGTIDSLILENTTIDEIACQIIRSIRLVNSSIKIEMDIALSITRDSLSTAIFLPSLVCDICKQPIRGDRVCIKDHYIHRDCFRQRSYSTGNFDTLGNSTKLPPFGFELELFDTSQNKEDYDDLLLQLILHGFKRCSDGTVSDEMKSPILRSDKWLIEGSELLDEAAKKYITPLCGTHIHVSSDFYAKRFYSLHYHVFTDLTDMMHENKEQTTQLWGRFFTGYAAAPLNDGERHSWLNLNTDKNTIEYRLPVITSVKQYRRIVWFVRLFTLKLKEIYEKQAHKDYVYYSKIEREITAFYTRFLVSMGEK